MVPRSSVAGLIYLILACVSASSASNMVTNGSFELGMTGWSANPECTVTTEQSGWHGVTAAAGITFLAASGPVSVGYSYVQLVTQSLSPPFGGGVPNDNFVVYLYASTYLHTSDGRHVSYALTLEPGYGAMVSSFYGGSQDAWVTAQACGYYYAHDPYEAGSPTKPLKVILELRDPLQEGEYLLTDNVQLLYGGYGVPEPPAVAALAAGLCGIALRLGRMRRWR